MRHDGLIIKKGIDKGNTMTKKQLYTRAEFEDLRRESAKKMAQDKALLRDALDVKSS